MKLICPTCGAERGHGECCYEAHDAAWIRYHKRMTRVTAGVLAIAVFATVYVLAL